MSLISNPPLHDFPDRAIRELLQDPRNLRDTLMDLDPELASHLDFEHVELLPRSFLLEDWRGRESDLIFRVPYRSEEGTEWVLVCILLEHQSRPDPRMPLRTLIYTVLYWEREWKAWEDHHEPDEPLRLTAVLPVVFHTGQDTWKTNRYLSELIKGPEGFLKHIPHWETLFWDLADNTPEALLSKTSAWMQALAVVRAEKKDSQSFQDIFAETLQRLEQVGDDEGLRRHDLLWFVLSWAFRRRGEAEIEELKEVARASQADAAHQKEVDEMTATVGLTWEQREIRDLAQARVESELKRSRELLGVILNERFGALPNQLIQRIGAIQDNDRLTAAFRQAVHVSTLEELEL